MEVEGRGPGVLLHEEAVSAWGHEKGSGDGWGRWLRNGVNISANATKLSTEDG